MEKHPPASPQQIAAAEQSLNTIFPQVYKATLLETNGLSTDLVLLYGTDDIVERNETYEIAEYAQGYLAIGDDGGGRMLLMEASPDATDLVIVDMGAITPQAHDQRMDYCQWMDHGCTID